MIDIVFPKNNEKDFVRIAERLGIKNICFVYSPGDFDAAKAIGARINVYRGLLLKPNEARRARRGADLVIVKAADDSRQVLENKNIDLVFGLEDHRHKDFLHHRNSGLNQVLCSIAARSRTIIAIDFSSVLNAEPAQCARILGRMMQNAMLCRKYKVDVAVASFAAEPYEMRDPEGLAAFARIIGIGDAKASLNAIHRQIMLNRRKRSPDYMGEGVELIG